MDQTKLDLDNIKLKLFENINQNYPIYKAEEFISRINEMNDEEFIDFLKQQELIKDNEEAQCIFCSMIEGKIPTTRIDENENAIAILEINPISKGHTLIIPKSHINPNEEIPKEIKDFAKKVLEKLKKTFTPLKIDLIPGEVMNHQMINILPIYDEEKITSERKKETPEGLAGIKKQIDESQVVAEIKKEEPVKEKPKEEINDKNTWLPRRIP